MTPKAIEPKAAKKKDCYAWSETMGCRLENFGSKCDCINGAKVMTPKTEKPRIEVLTLFTATNEVILYSLLTDTYQRFVEQSYASPQTHKHTLESLKELHGDAHSMVKLSDHIGAVTELEQKIKQLKKDGSEYQACAERLLYERNAAQEKISSLEGDIKLEQSLSNSFSNRMQEEHQKVLTLQHELGVNAKEHIRVVGLYNELKAKNQKLVEVLKKYESCICDDGENYAAREVLKEMGIEE
jgi:hypothetical protein